jgi:hypothetical protein
MVLANSIAEAITAVSHAYRSDIIKHTPNDKRGNSNANAVNSSMGDDAGKVNLLIL